MMEQSKNNTLTYVRWFLIRLAMVLFDIFTVNIAYFMALIIRFYVAYEFNVWAVQYIPAYFQFAPYYTVCCLAVFGWFKLYNNKWKYASVGDLVRILEASLVTCVIQVAGSVLFVKRMPISYYAIGAMLQLAMLAVSRFSYRFLRESTVRMHKSRNKSSIRVLVVGVGETSRTVLKHFEHDVENAATPVCLLDYRGSEFGKMMEGLPIVSGVEKLTDTIQKYSVETVILADTLMPQSVRKQIRGICQDMGVGVQDFAGYFQDYRGAVSLRNLMEYTKGPVELVIGDKNQVFADCEQALASLNGKYVVSTISAINGTLVIELQMDIMVPNDVKEEWVQSYREETGEDISFF